ncbi:MAG: FGGY-family carbohydrate kinase [Streptosporangiaceae bacterium]
MPRPEITSARQPVLLGLDVGTTSVKAVLVDIGGRELSRSQEVTRWSTTPDGVEHDPLELLEVTRRACRAAIGGLEAASLLGVGVTSFAESGVLLDGHGQPVAPLIAWHDERDRAELSALADEFGPDRFARRTGLPMWPQWSLTKHRWLMQHRPGARAAVRRLNVAEWVVRSLGGEEVTEQSLASRTGWLGLASRQWWTEALDWSGARGSLFPPLVVSGTPLGTVSSAWGVAGMAGAVITVAGHDHQAAVVGLGAAGPGDEVDSCGTAEALVRTIPAGLSADMVVRLARAGITVGWHVLADRWAILGATQGGLELRGTLERLGLASDDVPWLENGDAARLGKGNLAEPEGAGHVTVRPTRAADSWRRALAKVAGQGHAVHEIMTSATGPHRSLTVTGGWSRSQALVGIKRRLYGDLTVAPVDEPGARGAALLAGLAAGVFTSTSEFPPATGTN